MEPIFELPPADHQFTEGEDIYLIDKNQIDLWKAKIKKITKVNHIIKIEDSDEGEKRLKTTERLLERTEKNNQIYETQLKQRQELEKEMKDKEEREKEENDEEKESVENEIKEEEKSEEYSSNDEKNSPIQEEKKRKRSKKPRSKRPAVIDNREIVRNSWLNGIHEVESFRKYMNDNLNEAMDEYMKFYNMMNITENPPFKLGGGLSSDEVSEFWKDCLSFWRHIYPNKCVVNTTHFIRKLAEKLRLPNQIESNAREALAFIFDPETQPETEFTQFCAFMAMFGPSSTAIRKLGQFLKCPEKLKDSLVFPDIDELMTSKFNIDLMEMNCFTLNGKNVYNRIAVDTNGNYLVDSDGVEYGSWDEFFKSIEQKE
ncbi:39 kDa initiator binding protein [Histomonas meleagridis]|uniref:39 kDa initiator binding protein n=1 Tax=Histomonas meleagridis TaxID=135588 RepID=UPI00355A362D|nr:39 kDa initiator binding protein [Histomonas meleagridis]KAH0796254.1 39 kDa initiator binding protein [Histomonas meleagridis]